MSAEMPYTSSTMADAFDGAYDARPSPTMRRIFHAVYGDDAAPDEAAAFSFVSRSELERVAREVRVGAGQVFADLGCGAGGPGLWVARQTGAQVWGIDLSPEAIAQATHRARRQGQTARFAVGDFLATGLPEAQCDAGLSIDALWLAPDKALALVEAARILRPGGRLVCTTWESRLPLPGLPPQAADYQPYLKAAGFETLVYEETPDWERRQRGVYAGVLAAQEALFQEQGEAAGFMIGEASLATGLMDGVDYLAQARRVLIVAERR